MTPENFNIEKTAIGIQIIMPNAAKNDQLSRNDTFIRWTAANVLRCGVSHDTKRT
jgi:hypothetical protein